VEIDAILALNRDLNQKMGPRGETICALPQVMNNHMLASSRARVRIIWFVSKRMIRNIEWCVLDHCQSYIRRISCQSIFNRYRNCHSLNALFISEPSKIS